MRWVALAWSHFLWIWQMSGTCWKHQKNSWNPELKTMFSHVFLLFLLVEEGRLAVSQTSCPPGTGEASAATWRKGTRQLIGKVAVRHDMTHFKLVHIASHATVLLLKKTTLDRYCFLPISEHFLPDLMASRRISETTCGLRTFRTVRGQKLQQPTGKSCSDTDTCRGSWISAQQDLHWMSPVQTSLLL